jgi:tRNA (guanine37-N1)-methyltransferase
MIIKPPEAEMEQEARKYLEKNRLLHIDMLEPLRLCEARILYAGEDGVLIYQIPGGIYMLSAASEACVRRISGLVENASLIVLHQPYLRDELMHLFSLKRTMICHQAAWMKDTPAPTQENNADIRPLTMSDFPAVREHYVILPDEQYIRSRLEAGMLGVYVNGDLAGFIGTHPEGSIGLLEILPAYRRQGLAFQLESAMMRRQQALGRIPYAQIIEGNTASLALHEKLGMDITPDAPICWLY